MRNFSRKIWAISLNVLRENARDRMIHVLVGSGVVLLCFSLYLGEMFVGGRDRILQSFGFWLMGIWGLAAVLYMGSGILKREIQLKTVYLVLSRPISRQVFILGKFVGVLLVLGCCFGLICVFWIVLLFLSGVHPNTQHFVALFFIFGEWLLIGSLSLFFASFTSPMLHNFFLVGVVFLGHWSRDIYIFSQNVESEFSRILLTGLYHLLPNLEALNFRSEAIYGQGISVRLMVEGVGVIGFWIATFLAAACIIFSRRRLL